MTYLALNLSRYVNGVAKKHGEVSRLMFAGYTIDAITNGVHAATWASAPFQRTLRPPSPVAAGQFHPALCPGYSPEEIWEAHLAGQEAAPGLVNGKPGRGWMRTS